MTVDTRVAPRADELLAGALESVGNLVLDADGHWWALYKLKSVTYEGLGRARKMRLFWAFERALGHLATRAKILSLVRHQDVEGYVHHLRTMNEELPSGGAAFASYCDLVAEHLARRAPWDREHYLSVRLEGSPGERLLRNLTVGGFPLRLASGADRGRAARGCVSEETAERLAGQVSLRFGDLIERAATEEDLAYLVARGAYRALGADLDPRAPSGVAQARRLLSGVAFREEKDGLCFLHEAAGAARHQSHQRFLSISKMDQANLGFPDSEWAYLDLPVDLLLDFDVAGNPRTATGRKETGENGAPGTVKLGARGAARVRCHATVGVAAPTPEGLDELCEEVGRYYSQHLGIELTVPRSRQSHAWADFLPAGPRRLRRYGQRMSSRVVSGGMPVATEALGDGRGFYIGYLKGRPSSAVAYDPGLPLTRDMSGAACFVGGRGSGKVLAAAQIAGLSVLAGGESTVVDAAGELGDVGRIPELAERGVRLVEVGPESPIRSPIMSAFPGESSKALKATEILLRGFLIQLLGAERNRDYAFAIRLGVRDFMRDDALRRRGIRGLVEQFHRNGERPDLKKSKLAEISDRAAADLDRWIASPLASPVLGDAAGDESPWQGRGDAPLTVVRARGLPLPGREVPAVDDDGSCEEERVGQAVLSVIAASAVGWMADRARLNGRDRLRTVVLAQAAHVLHSPEGHVLLNYLIRDCRSQNVAPILCTEEWRDLDHIMDLIPIRFMGRQEERHAEDTKLGLRILGAETSPRNVASVKGFKAGDFWHQDVYGRVAEMHFDLVPEHWIKALAHPTTVVA
ncbi:MAG: ATP-binding protein [Actinomycetota bacterium]|nr:ATP-binding protein [Actinomycetota bacterium]